MAAVFSVNFSCLLSDIKVMFVLKIVHLWIEATPATYSFDESAYILVITASEDELNICMMKFLFFITLGCLFVCLWFPFPPGAWDRQHYLILHGNP